jgi:hypothetical protein
VKRAEERVYRALPSKHEALGSSSSVAQYPPNIPPTQKKTNLLSALKTDLINKGKIISAGY